MGEKCNYVLVNDINEINKLSLTKIISLVNSQLQKLLSLVKNVDDFLAEKTKAEVADEESV